jgi:hypothetical protein
LAALRVKRFVVTAKPKGYTAKKFSNSIFKMSQEDSFDPNVDAEEVVELDEEQELELSVAVEFVLASLKGMRASEMMKIVKAVTAQLDRKIKSEEKHSEKLSQKAAKGNPRKGFRPPQLRKNVAWVEFVLKDALKNGWPSFTVPDGDDEIQMPKSVFHNGAHIYENSITEDTPDGRQIIRKQAMSLSKMYKTTGHDLVATFEAEYEQLPVPEEEKKSSEPEEPKPKRVMSLAEKEAERARLKAEKEKKVKAEKAAAKAEKDRIKAEQKAQQDAIKAKAKAAAAAAKAVVSVPKKAVKKSTAPVKADGVSIQLSSSSSSSSSTPLPTLAVMPKLTLPKRAATPAATVVAEWSCPNDDGAYPWAFKGRNYLRNYQNEVWLSDNGSLGKWVGVYKTETKSIDTSVPEPDFE